MILSRHRPVSPNSSPLPPPIAPVTGTITLTREKDGHFYADALVNGASVRFIVDTGATTVTLSRADAQKAEISMADGDFTGKANGAGGPVRFKPVILDSLSVGPVQSDRLQAAIVEGDLNISLLGQNWLKRFENIRITGDTMILN